MYPINKTKIYNSQNPNAPPTYTCGKCHKQINDNDQAILCESGCHYWYHRYVNVYFVLVSVETYFSQLRRQYGRDDSQLSSFLTFLNYFLFVSQGLRGFIGIGLPTSDQRDLRGMGVRHLPEHEKYTTGEVQALRGGWRKYSVQFVKAVDSPGIGCPRSEFNSCWLETVRVKLV